MSDHPEEFIPGIWVSEQVADIIDKHPDFKGIHKIADATSGDFREREVDNVSLVASVSPGDLMGKHDIIAPGAFKDLPKKVPFKNEAGDVIGEALVSEVDGEILMEIDIDPESPEAKYFTNMMSVTTEEDNGR